MRSITNNRATFAWAKAVSIASRHFPPASI
jgi:hypothetical protein